MKTPTYGNILGFNPTGDLGPFTIYTAQNRKPVWYIKAPPTAPPTDRQVFVRETMKANAISWTKLRQADRDTWELATKRCRLKLCGYALWQWYQWHHNRHALRTIELQSRLNLPGVG